jgi:hypothetical protein
VTHRTRDHRCRASPGAVRWRCYRHWDDNPAVSSVVEPKKSTGDDMGTTCRAARQGKLVLGAHVRSPPRQEPRRPQAIPWEERVEVWRECFAHVARHGTAGELHRVRAKGTKMTQEVRNRRTRRKPSSARARPNGNCKGTADAALSLLGGAHRSRPRVRRFAPRRPQSEHGRGKKVWGYASPPDANSATSERRSQCH